MRRICKYCGKAYEGAPGGSCCPDCAAARRRTSLRLRTCAVCGSSFVGGPSARYCPGCRAEIKRERERIYKRRGSARKLGSTDICAVCGKPYTVMSGNQKYCPDCADEAIQEADRAKSRAWYLEHTTPDERRRVRQTAAAPIPCAVCGKLFVPTAPSITCSPACSAALHKRSAAAWERDHRAQRNEYHKQRIQEREATMTPEEYAAYRERINERARGNHRKKREENKEDSHHDK